MKIKDYNGMMSHLTRPDTMTPERRAEVEAKKLKADIIRRNKVRAEYGVAPVPMPEDPMVTFVKNNNANNENPGTFKRLVEQDEKEYKQKQKQMHLPGMEPKKKKGVLDTLNNNLVKNYNLYEAEPGGEEMIVGPNGQIMMESELKKKFEKEETKQATPEQVGKLAERLERNAQMTGGKGPLSRAPKEQSPFIKHRQKVGDVIRNQKDKKVVLLNNTKPIKFEFSPILRKEFFEPVKLDPQTEALGKKVFAEARESEQERIRNRNSGLGYFSRGTKFNDE